MFRYGKLMVPLGLVAALAGGSESAHAQAGSVSGQAVDAATLQPLSGVQVFIPGLQRGTLTQANGRFLLINIPAGTHQVSASIIGYQDATQEISVGAGETATVNFNLRGSAISLDAVVVTGTGVQEERRRLGFASSAVTSAEIEERPIQTVTNALRGQIAGVMPSAGVGDGPGAASPIRIRGQVSLTQRNEPLLIVDGVRQDATLDQFKTQLKSRLDDLNPADIERIEVIKGAAAATLFGTEASAGVIQVFTKRGQEGPARYTLSIDQGLSRVPLDRIPPNRAYNFETKQFVTNNPMGEVLKTGHLQNYNLSIAGGIPDFNYYVSGRYMHDKGAAPATLAENMSIRSRFDMNHGSKFRTELGLAASRNRIRAPNSFATGPGSTGVLGVHVHGSPLRVNPEARLPYGEGFLSYYDLIAGGVWDVANRLAVDFKATYRWTPNLTSQVVVGYSQLNDEETETAELGESVLVPANATGRRAVSTRLGTTLTLDANTSWQTRLSEAIGAQIWAGGQAFFDKNTYRNITAVDFPAAGLTTISAAGRISNTGESITEVVNAGLFTQLQIDVGDRLFITTGLRADGNSAFGESVGLTLYPKISGSYVLSDETFWPVDGPVSLFRIRSAFGQSGLQPGAFDALQTWNPRQRLGGAVVWPDNVGNPDLRPERSTELEMGIDLGLLQDRLGVELTYFHRKTTDLIVPVALRPSHGFSSPQFANVGEMVAQGYEALVNWNAVQRANFDWTFTGTLATVDQKVTDLGGVSSYVVANQRAESVVAVGYAPGVFRTHILDENDPYELSVPIEELRRLNQISANRLQNSAGEDSLVFHKAGVPEFTATASTEMGLPGGIRLRALFSGARGFSILSQGNVIWYNNGFQPEVAGWIAELDDPNTTPERRAEIALNHARKSDRIWGNWIEDGDYIRFQELSLSYRIPPSFGDQFGLNNVSLSLAAQNLKVWTTFTGLADPGTASQSDRAILVTDNRYHLPAPRSLTLSVQASW